jgi:competence protein ComEC
MRRETLITACFTFLAFILLAVETAAWIAPPTLRMFDVGQGDGILLSSGGTQILVDGGPDGSILSHLGSAMPFFDRTVDLLVLSHPHMDHLQSFPELLRRYRVKAVLMTGVDYANPRYEEFLTLLADEGARLFVADPTQDLTVGPFDIDVLWPPPRSFGVPMKDVNDDSVALRVTVPNGKTILFTGDMEEGEERKILQAGVDVRADILKVAHHGSRTSSSTGFLLAVRPSLAIASVAKDNSYGLPDEDVTARYAKLGIPLRMTMDEGTIVIPLAD